jgi:transposase-like protein
MVIFLNGDTDYAEKKWSSKDKLTIVLERLKGKVTLGELCAKFQISQSQYYKWRDQFLVKGSKIFDYGGIDRSSEQLLREIKKLKHIIGDLTVEFKKSEYKLL